MNEQVFVSNLDMCQRHADRMAWAMTTLVNLRPLSPEKLASVTAIDLAVLDQFVIRFTKLQDAMGARLLPSLLELTQEPGSLNTFIDKLNRLEKIGAIESAERWQKFREMRNQFAHDYPDDPAIQASLLNKGFDLAEALLSELETIKTFAGPYLSNASTGLE